MLSSSTDSLEEDMSRSLSIAHFVITYIALRAYSLILSRSPVVSAIRS